MADIFISYSQKDRPWVKCLVDALSAEGYEVWWDLEIRAGESFDELIESTLEKVSCVVGVWSKNSVKSEWVRAESAWAKDRGLFVSGKGVSGKRGQGRFIVILFDNRIYQRQEIKPISVWSVY